MGGPGGRGPKPPGGGVTGAAPPLRGVAEDRRAGARGETGDRRSLPLLSTLLYIYLVLIPILGIVFVNIYHLFSV
jgi:nitrate reductase NapE component